METGYWRAELSDDEARQKAQDFAWALLSAREFVTNH
jgi:hypothetical protein